MWLESWLRHDVASPTGSLQGVHPEQEPSVLAKQSEEEPRLQDQKPNEADAAGQGGGAGGTQAGRPVGDAGRGVIPAGEHGEGGQRSEHSVANERRAASWGRVKLAEAVALRLTSFGQADADAEHEGCEQDKSTERTPTS